MARPAVLAAAAVPAIVASFLAVGLLTQEGVPPTAAGPGDELEVEYTRHHIRTVSFGATERAAAQSTEVLLIGADGRATYAASAGGAPYEEAEWQVDGPRLGRLAAMIKETGFTSIPQGSFPAREGEAEYVRSTVRVTLNGETSRLSWPGQEATDAFVPPIVAAVEAELLHAIGNGTK